MTTLMNQTEQAAVRDCRAAFEAGQTPSPRQLEAGLRAHGLSRRAAAALMSDGLGAINPAYAQEMEAERAAAAVLADLAAKLRGPGR
jgi:hypothetical protein